MADLMKKGGRPLKYPGDEAMAELVMEYETKGATSKSLAEQYDVSPSTIRSWVLRYKKRNDPPASKRPGAAICREILSFTAAWADELPGAAPFGSDRRQFLDSLQMFMINHGWIGEEKG